MRNEAAANLQKLYNYCDHSEKTIASTAIKYTKSDQTWNICQIIWQILILILIDFYSA